MTRIRGRNGSAVQALGAQPGRCVADEMLLRMWEHLVHGEPKGRIWLKLVFTLRSEDLWTCSSFRSSVLSSLSPPFLPVCMGTCLLFHIPVSPHLPQYGTSFFFFFPLYHTLVLCKSLVHRRCNFLQEAWLTPVIDLGVFWVKSHVPKWRHLSL